MAKYSHRMPSVHASSPNGHNAPSALSRKESLQTMGQVVMHHSGFACVEDYPYNCSGSAASVAIYLSQGWSGQVFKSFWNLTSFAGMNAMVEDKL